MHKVKNRWFFSLLNWGSRTFSFLVIAQVHIKYLLSYHIFSGNKAPWWSSIFLPPGVHTLGWYLPRGKGLMCVMKWTWWSDGVWLLSHKKNVAAYTLLFGNSQIPDFKQSHGVVHVEKLSSSADTSTNLLCKWATLKVNLLATVKLSNDCDSSQYLEISWKSLR